MGWLEEQIVERFLSWDLLGRGQLPVCDWPVTPEPPFREFPGYHFAQGPTDDDGRVPSLLDSLLSEPGHEDTPDTSEEAEPAIDFRLAESFPTVEIRSHLPKNFKPKEQALHSFLLSLSGCHGPISFELWGDREEIRIQFVAEEQDASLVQRQATTWFPEAYFSKDTGELENALEDERTQRVGITECGLAKVFCLPLPSVNGAALEGLARSLTNLDPGELGLLQVLFEPTRHPWARDVLDSVICEGEPFFADGEALAAGARRKVSTPLFGVTIRFAVTARDSDRLNEIMRSLLAPLSVFSKGSGNELEPFYDEEESEHLALSILTERSSQRFGMILNLEELAELVRFPTTEFLPQLVPNEIRSRPVPEEATQTAGLELGIAHHRGQQQSVCLNTEQRVRHMHLIGASGTGKSTLLRNLIRQDLENGEGLALLDPHGDLVDAVLAEVPPHRVKDVILLDPSDEEFPVGFNILSAHSELEKTLLASDLCSVFRRFSTSWGDQMTAVLSNAILAFLESSEGGTLSDLRRFLVEKPFRKEFLSTVQDPEVVYFWEHDHALLSGRPEGSVVTRLNSFLRPKPIRHMVSQKENKLDLASVMDEGKVLLARIPQGLIGEENAHLLGSLLVSKIHQLVLGRQARGADSRRPFWLYVDEFPHFMTTSMAAILSGARKYHLGLTLAHQDLRQLEGRDRDVASAVLSNAYTRVAFRLGDQDARGLEDGFAHYGREELQSLATGQAICRIGGAENDCVLEIPWNAPNSTSDSPSLVEEIRSRTQQQYGTPREEVEASLEYPGITSASESDPGDQPELSANAKESGKAPSTTAESSPSLPGRGGQEHKALQNFVKQIGEGFGYRATIEKPILDGKGHVDVALEREDHRVAVEISVTTSVDHEIRNAQKCLDAEFDLVILTTPDANRLSALVKATKDEFPADGNRLRVLPVSDLASSLDFGGSSKTGETQKGFQIKTAFSGSPSKTFSRIRESLRAILRRARSDTG